MILIDEATMKQALEALEHCKDVIIERGLNGNLEFAEKWGLKLPLKQSEEAITALREALAAQQEPVQDWDTWNACNRLNSALKAIGDFAHDKSTGPAVPDALWEIRTMAYDTIEAIAPQPAQRKPLTDEQIYTMYNEPRSDAEMIAFARAIEAAHGIKKNV